MAIDLKCSIKAVDGQGKNIPDNGYTHDGASVTFTITNNGTEKATQFVVKRGIQRYGSAFKEFAPIKISIDPGGSHSFAPVIVAPDGPTIPYQAFLQVDTGNQIPEPDEGNNSAKLNFTGNMP